VFCKRRGRDSNPRRRFKPPKWFSRPPHSTALPPLQGTIEARRPFYEARLAGSASRPLPLFYALSQAGRAIAAAHLDAPWALRRHGLSAPLLDGPLLDVAVHRRPASDAYTSDAFSGVVAATCIIVGFPGNGEQLAEQLPAHYPTSGDAELFRPQGLPSAAGHHTQYGGGYLFRWPTVTRTAAGHETGLDQVAPHIDNEGCRWLRPAVAGVALSPLLTWWTLLFGLSMLARYEPATWTAALSYDTSELAAPLDGLLQVALERVPELIFTALYAAI
jgi:hypothetical protein